MDIKHNQKQCGSTYTAAVHAKKGLDVVKGATKDALPAHAACSAVSLRTISLWYSSLFHRSSEDDEVTSKLREAPLVAAKGTSQKIHFKMHTALES